MPGSNQGDHTTNRLIAGIFVAALLAAVFISGGLWQASKYEREADNHAREYAAYTDEKIRKACFSLPPVYQKDCTAQVRHEQRDNERNERDLVAQRQSALWAFIMGAAAVFSMGLSVIGVFLVYITFAETKRANFYSKLQRDSLIASERAWLGVDHIQKSIPGETNTDIWFRPKVEGNSNAYGVQIHYTLSNQPIYAEATESHSVEGIFASGGAPIQIMHVPNPVEWPIYIIGYMSYSTMGEPGFKSYFCYMANGPTYQDAMGEMRAHRFEKADCEGLPANT